MKAQISRKSHRPDARYSGVYHVQGAMVTDADLDERSDITRMRTDDLGNDAIRDGVPEQGGAITGIGSGRPALRPGVIYADGVRGVFAVTGEDALEEPLSAFTRQADMPLGPGLPEEEFLLFADIWERPVHPLEDPYLADAGLHGAVTGFRTRTMVQIKAAPPEAEEAIEAGGGAWPQIGTARLAIQETDPEGSADACDPCAEVVTTEQDIANALWRLEVISVEGPANDPKRIALAWSAENAGVIAPADIPSDMFQRAGRVYEYFSPITECYAGVLADSAAMRLPAFVDDLGSTPSPDKDHDGGDWPFLRRWDGYAEIDLTSGTVTKALGGGFDISTDGAVIKLETAHFAGALTIREASVLRGDYWLVEMRRHAPEGERIRLVQATPTGILHHYCTLGLAKPQGFDTLSDAMRRKLSLPPLSDLPADHVGFDNNCQKLYGGAENVQQALDNLCGISAGDIAFDPNCKTLYGEADNVQEALDALCNIDFSVHDSFRLLFDWGVLCGLLPALDGPPDNNVIAVSAGAFLDRSGRIFKFPGGSFDLKEMEFGKQILFKSPDHLQQALQQDNVCLALAAGDGGNVQLYLVEKALAFGPDDPGFGESIRRCLAQKKILPIDDIVLKAPERRRKVANKLFLTLSGGAALTGSARLTKAEYRESQAFEQDLVKAYAKVADDEDMARLKDRMEQARRDNDPGNATGAALEVRQMRQAAAVLRAFEETDAQRMQRCFCQNYFPKCPPAPGEGPYFVPVGCIDGSYDPPLIFRLEVCAHCCRKQALTPRMMQYYIGGMRANLDARFKAACCPERDGKSPGRNFTTGSLTHFDPGRFIVENNIGNAFLGVDEKLPSDFTTRVPVNDLSEADATHTLEGTGVSVGTTIDVDDPVALEALGDRLVGLSATEALRNGDAVRPGDRVALLVQDGVARGYVLMEQGSGKLPFESRKASRDKAPVTELPGEVEPRPGRGDTGIGDVTKAIDKLREMRAELEASVETARAELGGLSANQRKLEAELDSIRTAGTAARREFDTLTELRASLAGEVRTLSGDVTSLRKERDALAEAVTASRADIEEALKATREVRSSLRGSQPLSVLGSTTPAIAERLAGEKVLDVNDMATLSQAKVTALVRKRIMTAAQAKKLQADAERFLKR